MNAQKQFERAMDEQEQFYKAQDEHQQYFKELLFGLILDLDDSTIERYLKDYFNNKIYWEQDYSKDPIMEQSGCEGEFLARWHKKMIWAQLCLVKGLKDIANSSRNQFKRLCANQSLEIINKHFGED